MPGILRKYVPSDERVILWLRPSPWFILIRSFWPIAATVAAALLVRYAAAALDSPTIAATAISIAVVLVALVLLWQLLQWLSRLYVLTEHRLIAVAGILLQNVADVPVRNVRNVVLVRRLVERLLGLGTLGAATAGTDDYELVWLQLARPDTILAAVRSEVDRSQATVPATLSPSAPMPPSRPIVIGLTGGIGAGKTEVAALLAEQGYAVIDSDRQAKETLDRPEVREELLKWWGDRVLGPDGRIDRRAVAQIIFSDQNERSRLEQLVHPLVKANRAELVDTAAREGKPGVVVDSPLLLESGSDKECDVIIFVDSPREQRLARVQSTRGWDEAELARREKAQLPLVVKRQRSDVVIVNDSTPQALRRLVCEFIDKFATRTPPAR
jgi:dephospho-CoA kinase